MAIKREKQNQTKPKELCHGSKYLDKDGMGETFFQNLLSKLPSLKSDQHLELSPMLPKGQIKSEL